MSAPFHTNFTRVMDLLADRSVAPLPHDQEQELRALIDSLPTDQRTVAFMERDRLERAAAETLAMFMQADRPAAISSGLRDRLIASGMAELAGTADQNSGSMPRSGTDSSPSSRTYALAAFTGWLAAAAALVFAFVLYQSRPTAPSTPDRPSVASVFESRAALLDDPATVVATWSPGPDPAGSGVSGDVAWNPTTQTGYLRFSGLAENDPARFQYQLWIFDKGRQTDKPVLDQFPVDGGVFDITTAARDPNTGDVIVPITPKLPVRDVAAFAVTSEKPGGVVVTTRENLLLLAPVGG